MGLVKHSMLGFLVTYCRTMNNRYYKRSKILETKFRQLLRYFAMDLTAAHTAQLTRLSRQSVAHMFGGLRTRMAAWCEQSSPLHGTIEVDVSCFGPRRIPGKRGRGALGKTIVFGLFEREGKVCTEIVSDARKKTLPSIVRDKVASAESVSIPMVGEATTGRVDMGHDKHYRAHHSKDEFADGTRHINGTESFWSYAKRRLVRFNGVPASTFYLHVKETGFRFNHRSHNLFHVLLKHLRDHSL